MSGFQLKPICQYSVMRLWIVLNSCLRHLSLKLFHWGKRWGSVALLLWGEGKEEGPPRCCGAGVLTRPLLIPPCLGEAVVPCFFFLHGLHLDHRDSAGSLLSSDGEENLGLVHLSWPLTLTHRVGVVVPPCSPVSRQVQVPQLDCAGMGGGEEG